MSKYGTPKRVTVNGKRYAVRYAFERSDGVVCLVCNTDELGGTYGDEIPVASCDEYRGMKIVARNR